MLLKQDFYFESLHANRPLHIRVPDGGDGPYPVMYFFDGHNLFRDEDATYGKCWGLDEYLAEWNRPLIIVGVECGHVGDERLSEYLPYPAQRAWLNDAQPLGDATMRGILFELKPYIDRVFRTLPDREHTGIGGSSMGGLMSAYAVLRYNQVFSKAACLSPSLGAVAEEYWRELEAAYISPDTRVYLSWGTLEAGKLKNPWQEDRRSGLYRVCAGTAARFEAKGASARIYCQVGGRHCEADWEKQLGGFMPWRWENDSNETR